MVTIPYGNYLDTVIRKKKIIPSQLPTNHPQHQIKPTRRALSKIQRKKEPYDITVIFFSRSSPSIEKIARINYETTTPKKMNKQTNS